MLDAPPSEWSFEINGIVQGTKEGAKTFRDATNYEHKYLFLNNFTGNTLQ
jgi:hypothetical protein